MFVVTRGEQAKRYRQLEMHVVKNGEAALPAAALVLRSSLLKWTQYPLSGMHLLRHTLGRYLDGRTVLRSSHYLPSFLLQFGWLEVRFLPNHK